MNLFRNNPADDNTAIIMKLNELLAAQKKLDEKLNILMKKISRSDLEKEAVKPSGAAFSISSPCTTIEELNNLMNNENLV